MQALLLACLSFCPLLAVGSLGGRACRDAAPKELRVADPVPTFLPWNHTGSHAGRIACPVCVHGRRPSAAIWARPRGLADAVALARALDGTLASFEPEPCAGYVVLLPDAATPEAESRKQLESAFAATPLQRVYLTVARPQENGDEIASYGIPTGARTRTIAYVNRKVATTFADLRPAEENGALFKRTLEPLFAAEEPCEEGAIRMCDDQEPGQRMGFYGRVRDAQGRPLANAAVVAYQADASGLYAPRDSGTRNPRICGVAVTSREGWYRLQTVRPGSYPGTVEPAHIHLTVAAPFHHIHHATLWFDDDKFVEALRARKDKETVIVAPRKLDDGGVTFRHDIALAGN
jgi:protocatechuate 3,4-dioxygenase beta subunit